MSRGDAALERVLVLMPLVRDAERTVALLQEAEVRGVICAELTELCAQLRAGADAVVISDEVIFGDAAGQLAETIRAQPAWSAVPVIVLAREGATHHVQEAASEALNALVILERPVRTRSLLSIVLSAVRGRRHQYQIRDAMLERERQALQLARQAEQLRDNDRRKDEFLATLAHELRNPLAPVRTGMDLLSSCPEPEAAQRALGVMSRQLDHMVRLVDDLLDVSRITRGKLELKRGHVTLRAILDAAIEGSRPWIDRGQHTLRVSVSDESLCFDADLTRMAQVVSNLLNNAAKFTPTGGLIELSAAADGEDAVIEVRDNGIGIPREQLTGVFAMFSQVGRELDRTQSGLGIGLALVRSLVEMHGGSVRAQSSGPGRGSVFTIQLPRVKALPVTARATQCSSTARGEARRRILIVDDNEDAAGLLALMLEHNGCMTTTASDGPSALSVVETWHPDLVILDIGLPGMNGFEVARELRRLHRSQPELIALTGWGTHDDKRKAREAGFDLHLTKPIDAQTLYNALAELDMRKGEGDTRPVLGG